MTTEELKQALSQMSQEEEKQFWAAVNSSNESKAAFLRDFIGEKVEVVFAEK